MRHAAGQSTGPLEVDRPWDAYTDDHLGLMDHLGIDRFMVLGFCIAGPFIWNLIKRAPDRVVAAVPAQPVGFRPELPNAMYESQSNSWGAEVVERDPDITTQMADQFLNRLFRTDPDFVFTVTRDFVRQCQTPVLVLPDDTPGHSYDAGDRERDAGAKRTVEHVPLERHPGEDSAGGAPRSQLPAVVSASLVVGHAAASPSISNARDSSIRFIAVGASAYGTLRMCRRTAGWGTSAPAHRRDRVDLDQPRRARMPEEGAERRPQLPAGARLRRPHPFEGPQHLRLADPVDRQVEQVRRVPLQRRRPRLVLVRRQPRAVRTEARRLPAESAPRASTKRVGIKDCALHRGGGRLDVTLRRVAVRLPCQELTHPLAPMGVEVGFRLVPVAAVDEEQHEIKAAHVSPRVEREDAR